jgi:putative colanic acid biosynthesis glycosyltransferase
MAKILQINSVINYGSTGHIAEEIGELVINSGWVSHIAHGRNKASSLSNSIQIGTNWDVKIHAIQTRLFDSHGLGSKQPTKKLIKKIKKINPDIIHLHNLHGYYLSYKILFEFLNTKDIPIIWTFHDCWPITGHCSNFDFVGCAKWKSECHNCPQKKEYPASFFIDRSKENYHLKKELFNSVRSLTIVTVSKWLRGVVENSFMNKYPINVINNGVDIIKFKQVRNSKFKTNLNIEGKFLILGVASIWAPRKGFDDFMNLSKFINKDSVIILVGVDEEKIKRLPSNVIGISRTESIEKLVEVYSNADVYLNLSVEETFGLTAVEAMSCGTPAIVYNATACPEVITPETGFVVEKGDTQGLLKAIAAVKLNGKSKYSKACRERVEKYYDKNNKYMDYLNLYKSTLNI